MSLNVVSILASMKVPPKRKGNVQAIVPIVQGALSLNESPSEKEGKSRGISRYQGRTWGLNESPSEKEGK